MKKYSQKSIDNLPLKINNWGMVFTLHRYIFRELMKVFILTTVALTLILSLGSILRPVQEYGVGPRQVLHLMAYFLPITLTFVLPMSALFASTLIYGRFASDNELDACRASGISILTLVYPGLALAIMVATANLVLSFHVMPAFVHRAEKSLKADAKQIIFRNIQRKGYYKASDGAYLLYADQANSNTDTLTGVIITERKKNRIAKIITAESAKIHFSPHKRFNEVQITAYKVYQMGVGDEGSFSAELVPLTKEFGSLMGDNIKFKKIDEMKRIRVEPMRFYPIAKLARAAYAQFTTELLAEDINRTIRRKTDNFYRLHSSERIIEFTAGDCIVRKQKEKELELLGEVVAREFDSVSRQPLRTLRCSRVMIQLEGDELAPTITMDIYNANWKDMDGREGLSGRQIIRGLVLPASVTDKFVTENVLKAIAPDVISSSLQGGPSSKLNGLLAALHRKIGRVMVKIKAEIHFRLVFGIGCVSLIMIGIGLGIVLKGGHLLAAFGASCLPATILMVCLMMGKNITKNPQVPTSTGVLLMWSGLVILTLLAAGLYRKLLKN